MKKKQTRCPCGAKLIPTCARILFCFGLAGKSAVKHRGRKKK